MSIRDDFHRIWGGDAPKTLGELRRGMITTAAQIGRATVARFAVEFHALPIPARDARARQIRDWLVGLVVAPLDEGLDSDRAIAAASVRIDARGLGIPEANVLMNYALHLEHAAARDAYSGAAIVGTPYEISEFEFRRTILASHGADIVRVGFGEALYLFPQVLEGVTGVPTTTTERFPDDLLAVPRGYEDVERDYRAAVARADAETAARAAARRAAVVKGVKTGIGIMGGVAKATARATRGAGNLLGSGLAAGVSGGESSETYWKRKEDQYRRRQQDEIREELHRRIVQGRRPGEWW